MAGVVLNKMSLANLVIRLGSLSLSVSLWHGNPKSHVAEGGRKLNLDFLNVKRFR